MHGLFLMKKPNTLSIIVDSAYPGEKTCNTHLYPYHPLENLLLALGQKGMANDIAKALGLESGQYFILSPVFFHTTHNDVLMMGVAQHHQQSMIYETLKKFVVADGFELHCYQDHLWLLHAPNMPGFSSEILPKVMHQSLKPFLDEWPLVWRQWFTEVQMLFHSLGLSTAHGVWLWGQGEIVSKHHLKLYPPELKLNLPSHLLANEKAPLQSPDIFMTKATYLDELQLINQGVRHVWYLWQNTDYWQHTPSLWKKIVNWCRQLCA